MAITTHKAHRARHGSTAATVRKRSQSGVVSERVNIPKNPSTSFVALLRQVGAGEGTIRRATSGK
jgi:hypothetical protein